MIKFSKVRHKPIIVDGGDGRDATLGQAFQFEDKGVKVTNSFVDLHLDTFKKRQQSKILQPQPKRRKSMDERLLAGYNPLRPRIHYRPFDEAYEAPLKSAYSSTPEGKSAIDKYLFGVVRTWPNYIKELKRQIQDDGIQAYTVFENNKPVGLIDTAPQRYTPGRVDIATWVGGSSQGKGIMSKARIDVMKEIYEKEKPKAISWEIEKTNRANLRVMEKLGFTEYKSNGTKKYFYVTPEQFEQTQQLRARAQTAKGSFIVE